MGKVVVLGFGVTIDRYSALSVSLKLCIPFFDEILHIFILSLRLNFLILFHFLFWWYKYLRHSFGRGYCERWWFVPLHWSFQTLRTWRQSWFRLCWWCFTVEFNFRSCGLATFFFFAFIFKLIISLLAVVNKRNAFIYFFANLIGCPFVRIFAVKNGCFIV